MSKTKNGEGKFIVTGASLARKAWVDIGLFVLAILMIVIAIYVFTGPDWAQRNDIKLYNQGVMTNNLTDELLPATNDRPAEYPIVRAAAYYQEVLIESTDEELKALAYYNLGTIMADNASTVIKNATPFFGIAEAYARLIEAVRLDPSNEDAKYNLELCEKIQAIISPTKAQILVPQVHGLLGGSSGYSSGLAHKGY
jgi:hypothetical protein